MIASRTATARSEMAHTDDPLGFCRDCDYPLRGLPWPRCPECGRAFDPADPATMNMGKPIGPVGRWLMRPITWPIYVPIVGLRALLLWAALEPGFYRSYIPPHRMFPVLLCLLLAACQAGTYIVRWVVAAFRAQPRTRVFADRGRWRVLWACVIVSALLVTLKLPLYAGFCLSHSSLEQVKSQPLTANTRIGIYTATPSWPGVLASGAIFVPVDKQHGGGFAYSPSGEEPILKWAEDCGRLWGDWYWFAD